MGEITGRKVFAITAAAFGLIIAVNLVMAWKAISTFPGLEVQNSYVASQRFDADQAAQRALGWSLASEYDPAEAVLRLSFADAEGDPAQILGLKVLVGRPTAAKEDLYPEFTRYGSAFVAPLDLPSGKWMLHVEAEAPDGTLFRQRIDLYVKG
ncbi:MAG: FixH family protein [Pseudorhodobacter sp.]